MLFLLNNVKRNTTIKYQFIDKFLLLNQEKQFLNQLDTKVKTFLEATKTLVVNLRN